jgi:hypothetical protein
LGQVVAALLVDEGGAQSPDLLVGGLDEGVEGAVFTGPG